MGVAPLVGRVSGTGLRQLADAAEASGSGRVRLTPQQKVVVLDVDPGRLDALLAGAERAGLTASPSPFRRHNASCTGIEFCKLALVETKATAAAAVEELERRLAGVPLDAPISLHVNGCPYSCARIQIADIGLRGQVTRRADGTEEASFQVHLGGGLTSADQAEPGFGRVLRGLKVPPGQVADFVERVTRAYLAGRRPGENFAAWAARAEDAALPEPRG